jgi:hypothetical protein
VSHLKRGEVPDRVPVHVTLRIEEGLPDMRNPQVADVFWGAFEAARERPGRSKRGWFRLVHYSIQGSTYI